MTRRLIVLIGAGIIVCLTGYASAPIALARVGPDALDQALPSSEGYLKVFAATQAVEVDFQGCFHPHMG